MRYARLPTHHLLRDKQASTTTALGRPSHVPFFTSLLSSYFVGRGRDTLPPWKLLFSIIYETEEIPSVLFFFLGRSIDINRYRNRQRDQHELRTRGTLFSSREERYRNEKQKQKKHRCATEMRGLTHPFPVYPPRTLHEETTRLSAVVHAGKTSHLGAAVRLS